MSLILKLAIRLSDFFTPPTARGGLAAGCADGCTEHYEGPSSTRLAQCIKWGIHALTVVWIACLVASCLVVCARRPAPPFVMPVFVVNVVAVCAMVACMLLSVLAIFLVKGFRQELREARCASIELARRTLAYETLLRAPIAAKVINSYSTDQPLITEQEAGIDPVAVRTAAYKLMCRERFTNVVDERTGTFLECQVRSATKCTILHSELVLALMQKGWRQPSDLLYDFVEPSSATRGFEQIMEEILPAVKRGLGARSLEVANVREALMGNQCNDSNRPGHYFWSRDREYERLSPAPSGALTMRRFKPEGRPLPNDSLVVMNPTAWVIMALAVESDELLLGRPYGSVTESEFAGYYKWHYVFQDGEPSQADNEPVPEKRRAAEIKKKRAKLDAACDFISATYGCSCARLDRNFYTIGHPSMNVVGAHDLAKTLSRAIQERVSLRAFSRGVIINQSDYPGLSTPEAELEAVMPPLLRPKGRSEGLPPALEAKAVRVCHKFYVARGQSAGLRGGLDALLRDIGRAELLIAPVFFAKTFLKDAYLDKRCREPNSARWLYGTRLRIYSGLVAVCSVSVLAISLFSAYLVFDGGSVLGMVMASIDLLSAVIALVCGVFAFSMSCRFFGYCERVPQWLADSFASIKQYLFDKSEDVFAVNVVERFLDGYPKGNDFPPMRPIGGEEVWR